MNGHAALSIGIALAMPCLAGAAAFRAPDPGAWPDTEAVTNVVFDAGGVHDEVFSLTLGLDASCGNSVEVAFGRDIDGDGALGRAEADLVVGWDSGEWFFRDRQSRAEAHTPRGEGPRTLAFRLSLGPGRAAKSLDASDGDGVVFARSVPPTLFDPAWNAMRIAARGLSSPDAAISCKVVGRGFIVVVQ